MTEETGESIAPTSNQLSRREQLECRKIEVELAQLQKPLWKHSGFWAATSAILVPIIGVLAAYGAGWFDLKQLEIKNAKTLLQAETTKLETQKELLTLETARLEATRVQLGSELSELNRLRSEKQQQIIIATNELQLLTRRQEEKERIIETLNEQVSKLTKENEAAKILTTQISSLQRERDDLQANVLRLRTRLAISYEQARNLVLHLASMMTSFGKKEDLTGLSMKSGIAMGSWRNTYDTDAIEIKLIEFTNVVSGIVDTNLANSFR